jgi:signal transduction histidine kinase
VISFSGVTRIIAGILVLSLVGLAGLGVTAFRSDFRALQSSTQENIVWSATQLEFELARFLAALGAFGSGAEGVDADMVRLRYDLLWSRLAQFGEGTTGQRLSGYDAQSGVVTTLFDALREQEPAMMALVDGDREAASDLIALFSRHQDPLRDFGLSVLHGEESNRAAIRASVRASAEQTLYLTLAALAVSLVGLVILTVQNRRTLALAESNRVLADEASAASRAKSRFLAMMSHELRTPMNGVLGLLALAKQPGLPRPQLRLVEQAERSGREMIEMLSDLLDLSALQEEELELERRPFAPRRLAGSVVDMFGPVARREGIELRAVVDPSVPDFLVGDARRLRQALARLAAYIVDTAGTRDIALHLEHADRVLSARLDFAYGGEGVVWNPELILGAPSRDGSQFASDALGPAVARMMIERMGGALSVETAGDGSIRILARIPLAEVVEGNPTVVVETRSKALEAICRAALRSNGTIVAQPGDAGVATAVVFEAGGDDERERVAALRARHPGAAIIALGTAAHPDAFDGLAPLPVDAETLRALVAPPSDVEIPAPESATLS